MIHCRGMDTWNFQKIHTVLDLAQLAPAPICTFESANPKNPTIKDRPKFGFSLGIGAKDNNLNFSASFIFGRKLTYDIRFLPKKFRV